MSVTKRRAAGVGSKRSRPVVPGAAQQLVGEFLADVAASGAPAMLVDRVDHVVDVVLFEGPRPSSQRHAAGIAFVNTFNPALPEPTVPRSLQCSRSTGGLADASVGGSQQHHR
jgi:hypothetical protein